MEIYRNLANLRFQGRSQGLFNVEAKEVGILEVVLRFSVGPGQLYRGGETSEAGGFSAMLTPTV